MIQDKSEFEQNMCFQIAPVIEDIDDFPMSIKECKLKQFYSKRNDSFLSQKFKDKTFNACIYYWLGNIVNLENMSSQRLKCKCSPDFFCYISR